MTIDFYIAKAYSYRRPHLCTLWPMIGHRIREARKQRGYNQQWLAEQIGVSQPSVSDWESGRNDPTMDNCHVPCDHIPIRSWPLFCARDVMRGLIDTLKGKQAT